MPTAAEVEEIAAGLVERSGYSVLASKVLREYAALLRTQEEPAEAIEAVLVKHRFRSDGTGYVELLSLARLLAAQVKAAESERDTTLLAQAMAVEACAKLLDDQYTEWGKRAYPPPDWLKIMAKRIRAVAPTDWMQKARGMLAYESARKTAGTAQTDVKPMSITHANLARKEAK